MELAGWEAGSVIGEGVAFVGGWGGSRLWAG